jgi:hypothetical protein
VVDEKFVCGGTTDEVLPKLERRCSDVNILEESVNLDEGMSGENEVDGMFGCHQ